MSSSIGLWGCAFFVPAFAPTSTPTRSIQCQKWQQCGTFADKCWTNPPRKDRANPSPWCWSHLFRQTATTICFLDSRRHTHIYNYVYDFDGLCIAEVMKELFNFGPFTDEWQDCSCTQLYGLQRDLPPWLDFAIITCVMQNSQNGSSLNPRGGV